MPFTKYAVAAAALISGAIAQKSCSTSGTLTITASEQATVLASCQTYSGSIAIATDVPAVSLDGPTRVTGDIVVENNNMLGSFGASSLRIVDGALSFVSLSSITTISMPQLMQAATFTIQSTGQTLLQLGMSSVRLSQVNFLTIADTFLNDISGITLETAQNVTIANNQLLTELNMPIRNVTGTFAIRGNTRGLKVGLTDLANVGSLLVNDVTSIQLDSLANSTGLMSFQNNDFQNLSLPNVTVAKGGFEISDNPQLLNFTVPNLAAVGGGLNIINNTDLVGNYSFPSLQGAASCTFEGNFTNIEMPELVRVQGTGTFASSQDIDYLCTQYKQQIAIPKCISGANVSPSSTITGVLASATSSHNAALSYQTASLETVFSAFGALAALFGLLM